MKIIDYLGAAAIVASSVVYAETNYTKKTDLKAQMVDQYQTEIDFINYKESTRNLSPEELWQKKYYTDKRDNLQKRD